MMMLSLERSVKVRSVVIRAARYVMTDETTVVGNVSK